MNDQGLAQDCIKRLSAGEACTVDFARSFIVPIVRGLNSVDAATSFYNDIYAAQGIPCPDEDKTKTIVNRIRR